MLPGPPGSGDTQEHTRLEDHLGSLVLYRMGGAAHQGMKNIAIHIWRNLELVLDASYVHTRMYQT